MKDLGEAAYILGIKIYRDRSKRLLGLSKRGHLPMLHGIHLSKGICPMTHEERMKINKIPYASAIRFIMYAMLCIRLDV